MKKMISLCLCVVLMLSSMSVFAGTDSDSKSVTGYGTLRGYIDSGLAYVYTRISYNNDNAYVTYKVEAQDKYGDRLELYSARSSRGDTFIDDDFLCLPDGTKHMYGTHGVQGGTKYSSAGVYTYTDVHYD